jgi:hypothetical protein
MLYSEIIAVCSQIHKKHMNTLCGQNVEFVDVKSGGTYNNHWTVSIKLMLLNNVSVSHLLPHAAALCFHLTASFYFVVARGYVQRDTFNRLVRPRHWFCKF